jgi:signal transduction histidine kinase/CHASE2 domain-containing sensor protein/ActR/RegA family two-component response regulator
VQPFVLLRKWSFLAPALAGAAIVLLDWMPGGPVDAARQWGFDTWQRFDAPPARPAQIVIVDIDEAALAIAGRWPWPRTWVARMMAPLAGARAVGMDILLRDRDTTSPAADEILASALRGHRVVLAVGADPMASPLTDAGARSTATLPLVRQLGDNPARFLANLGTALPPLAPFSEAAAGLGVSVFDDSLPVVRTLPGIVLIGGSLWPGFVVEVLRIAVQAPDIGITAQPAGITSLEVGGLTLPTTASGALMPRMAYARGVATVSASRLLAGPPDPAPFNGRIVLLGVSAPGLSHTLVTPLGYAVPALEVEAALLESALDGRLLARPALLAWTERFAALLLSFLVALLLSRRLHRLQWASLLIVFVAPPACAAWAFFGPGLLVDWVLPVAAMTATAIATIVRLASVSAEARRQQAQARAFALRELGLREAADAARQSLSLALDAAQLGVWDADLAGGTWRHSPQYAPILGLPSAPPQWSATTMLAVMAAEDQATAAAALAGQLQDRFEFECRVGGTADRREVRVTGQLWRDLSGQVVRVAGAVADITHERALEGQVRQGERMQAIGLLAGGVAHNFNNLLTIIIGKLDLARCQIPPQAPASGLLDGATAAAHTATQVARRLLAVARCDKFEPSEIDVGGRLQGVAALLRDTLPATLHLELDLDADAGMIDADPAEFDLALLNLVLNARDAMPAGGHIRIAARCDTVSRPNLALGGSYVVVSVTDDGPGVARGVIDRAFEPFVSTKPPSAGSGLGLTQVHGFARQAGGAAEIESWPGTGTTVRMYLPRRLSPGAVPAADDGQTVARAAEAADHFPPLPRMTRRAARARILLVDDEPEIVSVASAILTAEGFEVQSAANGPDALLLLRSGLAFDLLLSDIVMPGGLSGTALAAIVRQEFPNMRILLMTGYSEELAVTETAATPVLNKPYRASELCGAVEALLDTGHTAEISL